MQTWIRCLQVRAREIWSRELASLKIRMRISVGRPKMGAEEEEDAHLESRSWSHIYIYKLCIRHYHYYYY